MYVLCMYSKQKPHTVLVGPFLYITIYTKLSMPNEFWAKFTWLQIVPNKVHKICCVRFLEFLAVALYWHVLFRSSPKVEPLIFQKIFDHYLIFVNDL